MPSFDSQLPISECLDAIQAALASGDSLILEAPPGAGKTTCVPLALLNAPWLGEQQILMLQPRRVAARSAATRMAQLLGEKVGETVGYHIRQERQVSACTRITVMTEGLLTRRLQSDPGLENVGLLIFDEFHERNLDSDLGLAFCRLARELLRENPRPLKLLVMSATLSGLPLAAYLPEAAVVSSRGASHPVDIRFDDRVGDSRDLVPRCAQRVQQALGESAGDLLVFLPGQAEIQRCIEALTDKVPPDLALLPLHGSLGSGEQQQALQPATPPFRRKVILATDIAETSLTIDGLRVVIDGGYARAPAYDPNSGLTRLETRRISKASATQRSGRAGRQAPGIAYRLWTAQQHEALVTHYPAEILQADLAPLALLLLDWGIADPCELQWLDPPPAGAYRQALDLLRRLGALGQEAEPLRLSEHGSAMARLPCHPRLAHMLLSAEGDAARCLAADLAALLAERLPTQQGSDLHDILRLIQPGQGCPPALRGWRQRVQQQSARFRELIHQSSQRRDALSEADTLAQLAALAYPDRIARRHPRDFGRYKLANGRHAALAEGDALANQEWLVALEVGGRAQQKDDRIFAAVTLDPLAFEGPLRALVSHAREAHWDEQSGRFSAAEYRKVGDITLSEQPLTNIDGAMVAAALCAWIRRRGLQRLPWRDEDRQWQQRVLLLRETLGEAWPNVSDEALLATLEDWLLPYLNGISDLNTLGKLPLHQALNALLSWPQQQALNALAPSHIGAPSGNRHAIDYSARPPVLAVKLQEMFGCASTPRIAEGRVALTLHLLSPARRPLQITQDLSHFWQHGYQDVKKEMKGRYPKHPWPDDPVNAQATAATKRALARQQRDK